MMALKERAMQEIGSGRGRMSINIGGLPEDPDIKAFNEGRTTMLELVGSVGPDKPYELVEVSDNNYTLIKKGTKMNPLSRINATTIDKLWDDVNSEKFLHAYPELTLLYKEYWGQIHTASCSGCQKNNVRWRMLQNVLALDNSKRDLEPLRPIFGNVFCDLIKILEPIPLPPAPAPHQQPPRQGTNSGPVVNSTFIEGAGRHGPRPTCFSCCKKHIGQAVVLLGESRMGYPIHRWVAVGHMAEASEEVLREYPDLAGEIRAVRLLVQDDPDYMPDLIALLLHVETYEQGHSNGK